MSLPVIQFYIFAKQRLSLFACHLSFMLLFEFTSVIVLDIKPLIDWLVE